MKKYMQLLLLLCLLCSCISLINTATAVYAATAASYKAVPPFVTTGADPNVLLNLSIETPMQGAAYNDQLSDTCTSGRVDDTGTSMGRCYFTTEKYLGIFDPTKEYKYDSTAGYFYPVGHLNSDYSTQLSGYSGNFLNWATMTAIDEFRWALTGGRRTTDTTALTVIERANMTLGLNHSWYPQKRIKNGDNVAPGSVTPFVDDDTIYIYNHGYQFDIGTTKGGHENAQNYNVRVKVCDPGQGLEGNCVAYNNGAYFKPEGLIQNNAHRMRFAVMSYAKDDNNSRHGGVLRATMKYVGSTLPDGTVNPRREYGTDGIFIDNPDASVLTGAINTTLTNSGVINYVNKFGKNGYKGYDPISELFYECLNYFKHRGRTPEYADTLTTAAYDDFPVFTVWDDPIVSSCQPNFIVGINDANPWLDKKLPGTFFTAATFNGHSLAQGSDYGEPGNADTDYSVRTLTNTVGALQGINGTSQRIGCTAEAGKCDPATSGSLTGHTTNIPGLGEVMGTAPYYAKENSYYIAGLAYYANTQDIRSDLSGKQTVSTFLIDTQEYNTNPLVGQMNMLWLAGKYGGFVESDNVDLLNSNPTNAGNQYQPNLTSEWDANNDGEPDNYVLATDPDKLITGLARVFNEIQRRGSSGTAASVISGSRSGEGAVYQSIFYPEFRDDSSSHNKINWAGSVHASFVDALGRLREDTNQNRILDIQDKIFEFRKLADNTTLVVDKYSLVNAVAEVTRIDAPDASLSHAGTYFQLNSVDEKFYVWFTYTNSGGTTIGSDPRPDHDMTGISVSLAEGDVDSDVGTKIAAALSHFSNTFTVAVSVNQVTITNKTLGDAEDTHTRTSGFSITRITNGVGETTQLEATPYAAENIHYLWNANTWLNSPGTDLYITSQRDYSKVATGPDQKRYIFTFIDENQNKIADANEQRAFVAESLPDVADLIDPATIFPYIPVNADSTTLPAYIATLGTVVEKTTVTSFPAASDALQGTYFLLNAVGKSFYVWYTFDGNGTDPGLAAPLLGEGKTGIKVTLVTGHTAINVANRTKNAIDLEPEFSATRSSATITVTNVVKGHVDDAIPGTSGFAINVTQQGVTTGNQNEYLQKQTQRVINYIRGQDQGNEAITGTVIPAFRSRKLDMDSNNTLETTWKLGDIVYSSPTVVSRPMEALHLLYKDTSYGTFAAKYLQRRTVVYAGTNDGMLHAFNGGFYEDRFDVYPATPDGTNDAQFLLQPQIVTSAESVVPVVWGADTSIKAHSLGTELWAYIPYNLLPHLYWLTQPDYAHVYYVDLKPRVFDAKIFTPEASCAADANAASCIHPDGWGTVLVGGMRFGGGKIKVDMDRTDGDVNSEDRTMTSAFFVLDITNPEVSPTVLGEINFPNLGYTTCYPTVAAMKDKVAASDPNRWFLVFGSGPAETDGSPGTTAGVSLLQAVSNQKAKMYVVDLVEMAKNKVLKTIGSDPSGGLTAIPATSPQTDYYISFDSDNNGFISDPITVDYDLDYKADAIYFGTQSYDGTTWGGNLRRIVMDDNISPPFWTADSILIDLEKNAGDPATGFYQPISASPTVGVDPDGIDWVFFGTGRYVVRNDKDIIDQQTFYGIKEPKKVVNPLENSYTTVDRADLYNATNIEVNTTTTEVSDAITSPAVAPLEVSKPWKEFVTATKSFKGWYYNFEHDTSLLNYERNVNQAALFGNLTTFTTYIPSNDICTFEGLSNLYALYYLTGTAANIPVIGTSVISTTTFNTKKKSLGFGLASKPSVHVGKKEGSTAFVQTSDGSIIPIEEQNPGMTKSGKTAWSQRD